MKEKIMALFSENQEKKQHQNLAEEYDDDTEALTYNREEEYERAQRAAIESITVGRNTLETVTRQGEQLENARNLADETEYKLDKANRVLRGMTWSGWLANRETSGR